MIKLVAFDWNGTILSDTNAVVKSESVVLIKYGLKPTDLKEFQNTYTIPFRNYWINMGIESKIFDEDALKIRKIFFKSYEPLEKFRRTRSGAREILKLLKLKKIKSVIISNHPIGHIQAQLKRLKIQDLFKDILGYTQVTDISIMHKRGKGKQLKDYVQKHKYNANAVIVVGDTDEEIEIGKKFGYITIALTGGYQSTKRLKASKPDYLIHNLKDLKKIIQKINKLSNTSTY